MIPMSSLSRGARLSMAALAVALAAGSLATALALGRSAEEQVETATSLGLDTSRLADDLRRSESPVRARLRVARSLLAAALEEDPGEGSPGRRPAASPGREERLAAAEELARSVLGEHPASWEAAMVAGAATYVQWSDARDPRLVREHRRWEAPLLYALDVAPEGQQPARYLAAAYLELWPVLSDEKRSLARALVAEAFTDRRAFGRLLDPWLRVAEAEAAYEPIPDRPWAWATLRDRAGRAGEWEQYCDAWHRERRSLARELRDRLSEAGAQVRGGDLAQARRTLLGIVAAAPVEQGFAGTVEGALDLLPHGPRRQEPWAPAARWLAWAMAQELHGGEQPLSVASLGRLRAQAVTDGSSDPATTAAAAWVELVRDRPERARELAGTAERTWRPEWAPYLLLEARFHLERGHPDRARASLEQVHPDLRGHPGFAEAAALLGGGRPEPAGTEAGGRPLSGGVATPLDWSYTGRTARLSFRAPAPAGGLTITLGEAPPQGAALAVRWDGETLACRPLEPGADRLDLPVEIRTGTHRLEVEPLTAGRIFPGTVALLPPPPPGPPG